MYTRASAELKTDFYCRYGETSGHLYFERVGYPCTIMQSRTHMLAFSLDCGVRAYGREYGDVLRITDADSNICDVKFVNNGRGAQVLYKADNCDLQCKNETAAYTVSKLLKKINSGFSGADADSLVGICDSYGSGGWCAFSEYGNIRSIPLPLDGINTVLIRTRKRRGRKSDMQSRFYESETERIIAAAAGLKECRTEVFFEMVNESEKAVEMLLEPAPQSVLAVHSALSADGVLAARICDMGIICFVKEERTDSAIRVISSEYECSVGYNAGFLVVK